MTYTISRTKGHDQYIINGQAMEVNAAIVLVGTEPITTIVLELMNGAEKAEITVRK